MEIGSEKGMHRETTIGKKKGWKDERMKKE
jgi:hypothetical protein